jgi:archaellum component FlaC
MIRALDGDNLVDGVFGSYEARIQGVESLLETARHVLENFDNSVLDVRQEYAQVSEQLRENLAKNGSLRKKDFDTMMRGVATEQEQRGREVRELSKQYLEEQTQLVRELRGRLHDFTDALADGHPAQVTEHHQAITALFTKQQQRSTDVVSQLRRSQQEQQETAGLLRDLLAKGRELRIKDLKGMLAEFRKQRRQRLAQQDQRREGVQERREGVQDMLREFRAQRVGAEQDRRAQAGTRPKGGPQS